MSNSNRRQRRWRTERYTAAAPRHDPGDGGLADSVAQMSERMDKLVSVVERLCSGALATGPGSGGRSWLDTRQEAPTLPGDPITSGEPRVSAPAPKNPVRSSVIVDAAGSVENSAVLTVVPEDNGRDACGPPSDGADDEDFELAGRGRLFRVLRAVGLGATGLAVVGTVLFLALTQPTGNAAVAPTAKPQAPAAPPSSPPAELVATPVPVTPASSNSAKPLDVTRATKKQTHRSASRRQNAAQSTARAQAQTRSAAQLREQIREHQQLLDSTPLAHAAERAAIRRKIDKLTAQLDRITRRHEATTLALDRAKQDINELKATTAQAEQARIAAEGQAKKEREKAEAARKRAEQAERASRFFNKQIKDGADSAAKVGL